MRRHDREINDKKMIKGFISQPLFAGSSTSNYHISYAKYADLIAGEDK